MSLTEPTPCPFCDEVPAVLPTRPETQGNAWAEVVCLNADCPTHDPTTGRGVCVADGVGIADDRGSDAYKAAAVARWNEALAAADRTHPAREQSRQPQEGAGQGEAAAWTNERQLMRLRLSPKERAEMWGLQNGTINIPLYTTPPPAQAELDRLRDRVAALEGALRPLADLAADYTSDAETNELLDAVNEARAALNPQTGEAG